MRCLRKERLTRKDLEEIHSRQNEIDVNVRHRIIGKILDETDKVGREIYFRSRIEKQEEATKEEDATKLLCTISGHCLSNTFSTHSLHLPLPPRLSSISTDLRSHLVQLLP